MKKSVRILAVVMALLMMTFALVSCGDKSEAIKKAFEKEEWEVSIVDSDTAGVKTLLEIMLTDEQMEKADDYELILVNSGLLKSALIIKCASSSDLKAFLTIEDKDGNKDTSMYDDAKEDGIINGNCIILTLSGDAKDIFAGA